MRSLGVSGIWETFVPQVGDGERYKYEITSRVDGARLQKTDPYGVFFESDASGAAIVWDLEPLHLARCAVDGGAAAQERLARSPDVGLRAPPRLVEARARARRRSADLPRDGAADRPVREGHGLHAHRAAAGAGASLRRIVGLPGDRVLRADEPLRAAGRFQGVRRRMPRQRHRRDSRLGARTFSEGRARPRALRRHGALRARGSAAGGAPRLGHARLQLRAARSARVSAEQRAVLARRISHRRTARRCGRVDAVSRLLAEGRGVAAQRVRRPREPRGDGVSAAAQRADARAASRIDHRCRRIDGVAGRDAAGASRRARLHLQVEHGVDARHARVRQQGSHLPPLGAQRPDLLAALRVHRELHPAVLARRGRARQARDARQDARRHLAEARERCARCTATCTAIPARS